MKKILSVLMLLLALSVNAQDLKRNSVYVELGGSSPLLYNVTYDRLFPINDRMKYSLGIGGQVWEIVSTTAQANLLMGSQKHYVELGAATTFIVAFVEEPSEDEQILYPSLRIGYRYQRDEGGLVFRAALTPFYINEKDFFGKGIVPWGGISLGYSF